jgi:Rap1a immunity proteins
MTLFRTTLLAISATLLLQANAFSQVNLPRNDASTAALVELCKNLDDLDGQNFCFGFGEGVYQAYLANLNPTRKPGICFSTETGTREAILKEFLVWNQGHPQFIQERAAKTLVRFFEAMYPCK